MAEPTLPVALYKLDADWIANFVAGLPEAWSPHRRSLLPAVLDYWSNSVIDEYNGAQKLTKAGAPEIARDNLQRVHKAAENLKVALEAAFQEGSTDFMVLYTGPTGHRPENVDNSVSDILRDLNWLIDASSSAAAGLRKGPGRPVDFIRFRILSDIALIFRWVSKKKPARTVNRDTYFEEGPFWNFARAIWLEVVGKDLPQIGESAETGLLTAVKKVLAANADEKRSPILCNVHLNHPEWRIFEP